MLTSIQCWVLPLKTIFFNSVKFYHLLFLYIEKTSTNTVTEVVTIHSLVLLLTIYDGLLFLWLEDLKNFLSDMWLKYSWQLSTSILSEPTSGKSSVSWFHKVDNINFSFLVTLIVTQLWFYKSDKTNSV